MYCALAMFHWQWKESGRPEVRKCVHEMRWRLAGEYLAIGKQYEVTNILTGCKNEREMIVIYTDI